MNIEELKEIKKEDDNQSKKIEKFLDETDFDKNGFEMEEFAEVIETSNIIGRIEDLDLLNRYRIFEFLKNEFEVKDE